MAVAEPRSLTEITQDFGRHHATKKSAESDLKKEKDEFYEAATKEVEAGTLARRVIQIPEGSNPEQYVSTWHPGWRLTADQTLDEGKAQIEEDPELKQFVHVNHEDEKVYWRNVIEGSPFLDDERLRIEDPELWLRISAPAGHTLLAEFAQWAGGDIVGSLVEKFIKDDPFSTRSLRNLEEIHEDDQQDMTKYIAPGPLSLRMETPRKAKPEELKDAGE